MQAISDLFDQGRQVLSPFFKGPLNIMSGGVREGTGKASAEVVNKVQETSIVKNSSQNSMISIDRQFVRLAGLSGAIAVGLGAYGAHVVLMKTDIPEEQKNSFRTASMYHFFGTFGMVASSLSRYPSVSGVLMAVGTTIFCGSLYYFALTGDPTARKIAPFGITTLIAAWLSLIL